MKKAEAEKCWQAQLGIAEGVVASSMQGYFDGLSDGQLVSSLSDRGLRCMDEGTPGGVHLAGSGILLGLDKAVKFARLAMADGGLDFISYHQDCGAAAAYTAKHGGEVFANAESFARELGDLLDIEVREVGLERPVGFHTARAIYYDLTGSFDPSQVDGMLSGFVISRKYHADAKLALDELDIAIGIAFGGHGFDKLFDAEHPLLVVPVARNESHLHTTAAKLRQHLTSLSKPDQGRIKVDGLVV